MSRRDPPRVRNALSHGYFKIDQQIVWTTIQNDLPSFESSVSKALDGAGD